MPLLTNPSPEKLERIDPELVEQTQKVILYDSKTGRAAKAKSRNTLGKH